MEGSGGSGEGDRPIVNIVGDLVALGPHRRDLVPTYQPSVCTASC